MFNIRKFIMDTLKEMRRYYPDFQIREYALNWYSKGKLKESDLAEIEEYINPMVKEDSEIQDDVEENMCDNTLIE